MSFSLPNGKLPFITNKDAADGIPHGNNVPFQTFSSRVPRGPGRNPTRLEATAAQLMYGLSVAVVAPAIVLVWVRSPTREASDTSVDLSRRRLVAGHITFHTAIRTIVNCHD